MQPNFPRSLRFALSAVLLGVLAPAALAMPAHIVATAHMRAGPSVEYPAVAMLGAGTPLEVYGCEQAYAWCDVQAGPNRGWVDADYVLVESGGQPVILAGAGVAVGVPLVTFTLGTYWGSYYRTRPWYAQRAHYLSPKPPVARPPGGDRPQRPDKGGNPPPRPDNGSRPGPQP